MSDKYLRFSQLKGAGVPHSRAVLTRCKNAEAFPRERSAVATRTFGDSPMWCRGLQSPVAIFRMNNLGSIQSNLPGSSPGEEHKACPYI
jgi:hypothetical protein